MPGGSQPPGGHEGSFTDGALSLLRSSVGSASKDLRKADKPTGKAFQTAHDSSGWDRKARWQRAFNLARSKMGVQGMDESVDKWGAGGRDVDAGDRRSASALPARRASNMGSGLPLAGAPGTIAELRTPVALKEHLKRGKDARESGIQLVALEGGGQEMPLSDGDAAALVAQFDQRRQMLGAALCPGRQALTPADRALKAWTNNNVNSMNTTVNHINGSGSDRGGSSSSTLNSSAAGCSTEPAMPVHPGTATGAAISPPGLLVATTAAPRAIAIGNVSSSGSATTGTPGSGGGGFAGMSRSGSLGGITSMVLQRRLSESSGAGGDGTMGTLKRNSGAASESIIARQTPAPLQPGDSGSLHRSAAAQEISTASRSYERQAPSSEEPALASQLLARGSMSRQGSGALIAAVAAGVVGHTEQTGGWVPIPLTGSLDGGGSGGALRPTPRPGSAGRRVAQSQIWELAGGVTALGEASPSASGIYGDVTGTSSFGPNAGAFAPSFTSLSTGGLQQPHSHGRMQQPLPVLQVPPLSAEGSASPSRGLPSTAQPAVASGSGGGGGSGGENNGEPNDRQLLSPFGDAATPQSPALQLAVTSPAAAAGVGLMPVPPSASHGSPAVIAAGLRRPRPRISITGENGSTGAIILSTSNVPLSQGAWTPTNDSVAATGSAATAATPMNPLPPSRITLHATPVSVSSSSLSPSGLTPGYRRYTTSSPGFHPAAGGNTALHLPQQSPSSPPSTLRPHAPAQLPTPNTPSPSSPSAAGGAYRRTSITGAQGILGFQNSGKVLTRPAGAAPHPHSPSLQESYPGPMQQSHHQQVLLQPSVGTAPAWQTALKPTGAGATPRERVLDASDHGLGTGTGGSGSGSSGSSGGGSGGVRTSVAVAAAVTSKASLCSTTPSRTTPASDAVLAGLRIVATEVAKELSREAEMAAMTRQALVQRSRMRNSDCGAKPRHISLPGDPWLKWG